MGTTSYSCPWCDSKKDDNIPLVADPEGSCNEMFVEFECEDRKGIRCLSCDRVALGAPGDPNPKSAWDDLWRHILQLRAQIHNECSLHELYRASKKNTLAKLRCPNCGQGEKNDALCPQCEKRTSGDGVKQNHA